MWRNVKMKKIILPITLCIAVCLTVFGCAKPHDNHNYDYYKEIKNIDLKYTVDLSQFPTNEEMNCCGEVKVIADGKLLIAPSSDKAKAEYGKVVWLICDHEEAYNVGQVVTYTFRDVKPPEKDGDPLNIIALQVYME